MDSSRRPFREFDDSQDAVSLRLARRVIRGLSLSMRHVVLAPGSRSAPLAYALAEAEELGALRVHVRIDERSAAFTALGIAMDSGSPAGVVTTSGTATGNLLPAMMEADLAGVPLVAITADRPEELHGTGANQTTVQQGMFASRVRDEIHLEQSETRLEPESRDDMLSAETQVALLMRQAVETRGSGPGPVHLNIGFADPLVPQVVDGVADPAQQRWARRPILDEAQRRRMHRDAGRPLEQLHSHELLGRLGEEERQAAREQIRRGLAAAQQLDVEVPGAVVMGHDAPSEAFTLAAELGQPVLAEPTSGAFDERTAAVDGAVPAHRMLLQAPPSSPAGWLARRIRRVVVAGRPTLSRPVQQLLRRADVEVVQYAPAPLPWSDERLPRRAEADLEAVRRFLGRAPQDWRDAWMAAGTTAWESMRASLEAEPRLTSVRTAAAVAEGVRTPLLLGSSSVIRDVDLAADLSGVLVGSQGMEPGAAASDASSGRGPIRAMRGLSGIDGNVSAASGIAIARDRRVTALVGDLTFLHDLNALLIPAGEQAPSVDVVVVNDGGGAIFDQLEHGEVGRRPGRAARVERLFGTPQAADLQQLAAGHGVEHRLVEDLDQLAAALAHPDDRLGLRVIEVRTDRSGLRDLHARLAAVVAEG
ncbi:2-succinyl-5-enolpyruvyl-6-hydroxy-3-cyclohexene-1-carboxylic-acid synthase [Nesterenkonia sp. F]|uniref:2-succinyl-5-enolpyruvyl-6-hydroxy-3- cyclohexene-1-carboxylic-acid synthase n=1 Tax=Nesterenkonia sp. F TaxID=795955 RepID=UPI000255D258|nr:2-succinyl-5-enolpyruvyl-6-hydroxy-3-cyclohexene-1-carboxylic-acid synthase [Nesterenkonia sp. F]